jgi:hypothetical protein
LARRQAPGLLGDVSFYHAAGIPSLLATDSNLDEVSSLPNAQVPDREENT